MLRIAAKEWISHGFELHILSISAREGDFADQLSDAGWKIHTTGKHMGIIDLGKRLNCYIKKLNPDVVHVHQEAYGLLPHAVCLANHVSIIRTIHSSFQFHGFLRIRKMLERWISRCFGVRFIAISQSVLINEQTRFHNKCTLCWNWIDSDHYVPACNLNRTQARLKLQLPPDRFIVLTVGNASAVKNYVILIEALATLNMPDLLYCQVGNQHPEGIDQAAVERLNLNFQVKFCGPSRDVLLWLQSADLFVMPSLYEGFGLAAAEALATSTPCIFTNVPGLCDFKEFKLAAKWVEPLPEKIANSITEIRKSPFSQEELSISSSRARSEFGYIAGAARYASVWQDAKSVTGDK